MIDRTVALPCRRSWNTARLEKQKCKIKENENETKFTTLPPHQQPTDDFKLRGRETFCKDIRFLLGGGNVPGHNARVSSSCGITAQADLAPEEMVLQSQVLVLGGHLGDID